MTDPNLPPKVGPAPGLVWKLRKNGKWTARWQARTDLIRRGYPIRAHRLWAGVSLTGDEQAEIIRACNRLQSEMLEWSANPNVRRPKISKGEVYFVGEGMAVKIGFTEDVKRRFSSLQCDHHAELTLLATIPGPPSREAELHRQFRHLHIRGEWYRLEDELRDFIGGLGPWNRWLASVIGNAGSR